MLVPESRVLAPADANPDALPRLLGRLRRAGVSHVLSLEPLDLGRALARLRPSSPRIAPLTLFLYRLRETAPRFEVLGAGEVHRDAETPGASRFTVVAPEPARLSSATPGPPAGGPWSMGHPPSSRTSRATAWSPSRGPSHDRPHLPPSGRPHRGDGQPSLSAIAIVGLAWFDPEAAPAAMMRRTRGPPRRLGHRRDHPGALRVDTASGEASLRSPRQADDPARATSARAGPGVARACSSRPTTSASPTRCAAFGGEAVMTARTHPTGPTAWPRSRAGLRTPTIVVNVQGDEPLLDPRHRRRASRRCRTTPAVEPGHRFRAARDVEEMRRPNVVKVVTDAAEGCALYFSRSPSRSCGGRRCRGRRPGRRCPGPRAPARRPLRLPARGPAALRGAARLAARDRGGARAAARAGARDADPGGRRRERAATGGGHTGRPRAGAGPCWRELR